MERSIKLKGLSSTSEFNVIIRSSRLKFKKAMANFDYFFAKFYIKFTVKL